VSLFSNYLIIILFKCLGVLSDANAAKRVQETAPVDTSPVPPKRQRKAAVATASSSAPPAAVSSFPSSVRDSMRPASIEATNNWLRLKSLPADIVTSRHIYNYFSGLEIVRLLGCRSVSISSSREEHKEELVSLVDIFVEFSDVATAAAAVRQQGEQMSATLATASSSSLSSSSPTSSARKRGRVNTSKNDAAMIDVTMRNVSMYEVMWVCSLFVRWRSSPRQNSANIRNLHKYLTLHESSHEFNLGTSLLTANPIDMARTVWKSLEEEFTTNAAPSGQNVKQDKAILSSRLGFASLFPLVGSAVESSRSAKYDQQLSAVSRDYSFSSVLPTLTAAKGKSDHDDNVEPPKCVKDLKIVNCGRLDSMRVNKQTFELKAKESNDNTARMVCSALTCGPMCNDFGMGEKRSKDTDDVARYHDLKRIIAELYTSHNLLLAVASRRHSSAVFSIPNILSSLSNLCEIIDPTVLQNELGSVDDVLCVLSRLKVMLSCVQYLLWQRLSRRTQ
jgi:hypothetical protein